MENLNTILSALIAVSGIVVIIFILAKYSYQIKKAMIEKGLTTAQPNSKVKYIDIGCVVIGLGIGLLVSSFFTELDLTEDTTDLLVWGTICLFSGGGLLLAHKLRQRLE